MYEFRLDNILLPIAPRKLVTSVNNQNKVLNLIDGTEINIIKKTGLITYEMEFLLPNSIYPFAVYEKGYRKASYFLTELKRLKNGNEPFEFTVMRTFPDGRYISDTREMVTVESMKTVDDTSEGFDISVSLELKQFEEIKTTVPTVVDKNNITMVTSRTAPLTTGNTTYTVVNGDTLWGIAKRVYNDGNQYTKIFEANKSIISNPNRIYVGQVLNIPA